MYKFKIQAMLNKKQDSSPTADQVYRQYIEFVNEVTIPFPLSILMLAIPHIVILADLILKLNPDNIFIQHLAYLGISPMLYGLSIQAASLSYIINIAILLILLSPVGVLLIILYQAYWGESLQNGGFKAVYQKSFIDCAIRSYFISFSFVFLPVCVSYGTKILSLGSPDVIFGVLILIWSLINTVVIEYHIFELDNEDPKNKNLVPLNYPYHMLDMILIIIALVAINLTSGSSSEIIGLIVTALRLVLTFYVPFYNDFNQKLYKIICASSLIACVGLVVSYYDASSNLNLFLIFTLVAFLFYIYSQREEVPVWEQIKPNEPDPEGIQVIKNDLNKKSLYVKSFRSLIFLGRQNRSHRGQLQIEIIKSKCLGMENVHKGGTKVCEARDVIKFQENMVRFIKNVLKACEKSVSILKFMQSKDGRKQILTKQVQNLVNYLVQNKIIIRELLELNEYSPEAKFLLLKTFGQLYYDSNFLKDIQKWMGDSVLNDSQKELKQKLFNDKSVVLFINILEQIGKVVKISKNLPAVLGYEPTNILGLSINQIIPFSIKEFHDQNILEFLERYSTKEPAKNRKIKFYAYNSDFHLQEVIVRYSWVMNDFSSFYMAGVIERVESEAHVILTDEYGNLEGWTKRIGGEEFNLDLISISERQKYNIMPLFPTLIKYMDSLGVVARTIFFKNAKPRDSNLLVVDSTAKEKLPVVQARLLNTFKKLLRDQQIVGACFAQIQFVKLSLCQGRVNMRQITIREFQTLENLSEITSLIEKLNTGSSMRTDKSLVSCQELSADNGEKQERSLFSEEGKIDKKLDSNFTLIPEGDNFFPYEQLVFGQFQSSKTSFEISAVFQNSMRKKIDRLDEGGPSSSDITLNYTLHKNGTLFWYVLIITVIFLVLLILNIVIVSQTGSLFQAENKNIINRNKAASIYLKSIFNPNSTYIGRFANGSLLENMDYLYHKTFQYTTFLGNVMEENQYYLFNTQIPATLQRLITNPFVYSNSTVDITPPTSAEYYQQITRNYLGVTVAYHDKFSEALSVWTARIDGIKNNFIIRFVFLCFCSLSYGFLLLVTYYRERRHKETLEAFFKFEKEDLEAKIMSIGMLVREFEAEAAELNLLKEFSEIVKRDEITNVEFSLIKNVHEVKIKFQHDQQTENNLEKKKYYTTVGILIVFLLSQIVFLVVHMVINQQALGFYRSTSYDLDNAAKLIVLPNYLIADIYLPLPSDIKSTYDELVSETLAGPIASIPDLYPFLGTVPCMSCKFMYPVLTTNYKSFYSTFIQQAVQIKNTKTINKTKIQDLFYASDYVIENLTPLLLTSSYEYLDFSIIVYAISIIILCVAIYSASNSINVEIETFELFLRFFSQETITKNKHMSRLFSNFE